MSDKVRSIRISDRLWTDLGKAAKDADTTTADLVRGAAQTKLDDTDQPSLDDTDQSSIEDAVVQANVSTKEIGVSGLRHTGGIIL